MLLRGWVGSTTKLLGEARLGCYMRRCQVAAGGSARVLHDMLLRGWVGSTTKLLGEVQLGCYMRRCQGAAGGAARVLHEALLWCSERCDQGPE